jgi:hypothetical protein
MHDKEVEEVRSRRKELLKREFDGSMEKFGEAARAWEREHPERVVDVRGLRSLRKTAH